jgi:outer membrane protein insertion porin family
MRSVTPITASLYGLLVLAPAFVNGQDSDSGGVPATNETYGLPAHSIIDEIKFIGLHRIAAQTTKSYVSLHPGQEFDSVRISRDLRTLSRLGWFEDVSVTAQELHSDSAIDFTGARHFQLEFHVTEYPFLADVEYRGSKLLSSQQIAKMLEERGLSPPTGAPADPVKLHRIAVTIQAELIAMGHPEAQAIVVEEKLLNQRAKVDFEINDGPRLPVVAVNLLGYPELSDNLLRKQMHQLSPDAWFSGLRRKNIYTAQKGEEDRMSILAYLQNHGFPQARVGIPQITRVDSFPDPALFWHHRQPESGLRIAVPVEAGDFYAYGRVELSAPLQQQLSLAKKGDQMPPDLARGQVFSQHSVESARRNWELRLHRTAQRRKNGRDYRLQALPSFDSATHLATVRFDFDPAPPYIVRRVEFRGNQRFPDRYLRRRIGITEGEPLDEYALQDGLARITRTGYFEPFKKQDIQIVTQESGHVADVIIKLHEKGKQRLTFSGARGQFGSTAAIAYTVFNLLGLDEFISTQLDGGPESLQLAIGLAKEGFLGSRGTLALSVFDTFVRPRLTGSLQAPFQRSQSEGTNLGWTYAASDFDALGLNFGLTRSRTQYLINPPSANSTGLQITDLQSETSSHSFGTAWTHYDGEQKAQFVNSVSGGLLGGDENLLKSNLQYGHVFHDKVIDHRNSWAFRTTLGAVGSYKGDMPGSSLYFSGDDLVRGLRPGELGPYQTLVTTSSSGATTYFAVPAGADLVGAGNLEYRFPLTRGLEGATFFDVGSGLLLPNWLGQTRPSLIDSTNGLLHGSTGLELRWTLPGVGVPVRINYSLNILRLNRSVFMPDGSLLHLQNRLGALGWGLGPLF